MRFKKESRAALKEGATRVKTAFLWFPKCLREETRWLERATWTQRYRRVHSLVPETSIRLTHLMWCDVDWIG